MDNFLYKNFKAKINANIFWVYLKAQLVYQIKRKTDTAKVSLTVHPTSLGRKTRVTRPWMAEPLSKWGAQMHVKNLQIIFVIWIGNCDVTSIKIWRHYLYTIWRFKLHYFGQNYTTMKMFQWTTWNSNSLLQGRPRSLASLGLIIRLILTEYWLNSDWIKPFDALRHWNFHLLSFWLALLLLCDASYVIINGKFSW